MMGQSGPSSPYWLGGGGPMCFHSELNTCSPFWVVPQVFPYSLSLPGVKFLLSYFKSLP